MSNASLKAVATGRTTDIAAAARAAGKDPVVAALTNAMAKMKNVLPTHITPEKMARLSLGELRLNDKLREAAQKNPESFVSAVMLASQSGLEIGGAKGHGYLVPYKGEVTFMPGYRGLIDLARRTGQVTSIGVHVVYEEDEFEMELGLEERVIHKPNLDGDRGKPRLVYGVARFTDGSHHFDWMPMQDVDRIMKGSQSKGDWGPWKDHKPEMIRKTMIRRLTKYLPMSSDRLEKAVDASDAFDAGQTIDGDFRFVDEPASALEDHSTDAGDDPIGGTPPDARADAERDEPNFTVDQVRDFIFNAETLDALNDAAALISKVGNASQQKALNVAYLARRAELGGD